jgi:DNA-binding transcriptional LysR family regulator
MGATFLSGSNLNLLVALDALLAEGNVARAAERLGLSASAMSRALARLREETGDPLLVRAGRGLVPTPRAIELRDRVSSLVAEAGEVLRPVGIVDPARLDRRFTIRTSEGFVENFGAALLNRIAVEAPEVRLRFLQKTDKDTALLRDGSALRRRPSCRDLPQGDRERAGGYGTCRSRSRARPGDHRQRFRDSIVACPVSGAGCDGAGAPYREPPGRASGVRVAGLRAGNHRLDVLASTHGK